MGFSSSTSKTTPIYDKPIMAASDALTSTYNAQAPKIGAVADQVTGLMPDLLARFRNGDPALNATRDYITSTLGQQPGNNPWLDQMIRQSNMNVTDTTNAGLGTRGLTGGSVHSDILSRNLAQNETGLRYNDYNNNQQMRAQAAGMGPGVSAAQTGLLDPYFNAANAATMPLQAVTNYAGATSGLLGQYNKTKTSNPWGSSLLGAAGTIGAGFATSDIRAKECITPIGATSNGLPLYSFRYKGGDRFYIGPMAHEVAAMQPNALGPDVGGFQTVYYGEVR